MKITRAEELAKEQREISVSEFFTKNRHLLGFDNPIRALLTTIKELVDNGLDATDDMKVLPDIKVKISKISENRFRISVEDNGPGIVKEQIPKVFAKLLYGSKFFKIKQSRGQQGIGVSASVLYAQMTTGHPVKIISKTGPKKKTHYYELHINTMKNEPEILQEKFIDWDKKHGTKVELELEAQYIKGKRGVEEYLKQVAMVNPHLMLTYTDPEGKKKVFQRVTQKLPVEPKQIKPHPYGVEIGILMKMMKISKHTKLKSFLVKEFSRVSPKVADKIIELANLKASFPCKNITRAEADSLIKAISKTKIIAPALNCLSPIGSDLLEKGLRKEVKADFYATISRPPSVYRGFPFSIEVGICYGGELKSDESMRILRFANKVPLLYQQSACAVTKSITTTQMRSYGLQQSRGSIPVGPALIVVHIASVWVPFTSESKEAIAHYPEIIKQVKLALQDVGRKLGSYIRKTVKVREQKERADLFEAYIPEVAGSLAKLSGEKKDKLEKNLKIILKKDLPLILGENGKEKSK